MTLNDKLILYKLAAESRRELLPEERLNTALGGASGGLAIASGATNLYTRKVLGIEPNQTDLFGGQKGLSDRSFMPPKADTNLEKMYGPDNLHGKKVERRVASVAKRMGYTQSATDPRMFTSKSGKTVHFNPVKTVEDNAWINDIGESVSNGRKLTAKAGQKYADEFEKFIATSKQTGRNMTLGSKPQFQSRGTIAHELGHGQQSKKFLRLAGRTANWPLYGLALGAAQAALSDESNGGEGYALATVGALPRLANEFDASRRGAKAFRSTAGKLSAFKGLPSYALMAAAPAAAWGVTKAYKALTRRTDPVR